MKIKKIIGYILIAAGLGAIVYVYWGLPWYTILIPIGSGLFVVAFAFLIGWLLKEDKP